MPAHKRLSDEQITALMEEFRASRVMVREFCADKGIPVPTFRRWKKEWDQKREEVRLANLPDKLPAWMPPRNLSGPERNAATQDPLLALIIDLADSLGPSAEERVWVTLCCDGLIVLGQVIGGQEYIDAMREFVLRGAAELSRKCQGEVEDCIDNQLPDTDRLPGRREEWDEFFRPDEHRDAPEFIHLSDVTITATGQTTQTELWRGRLSAVTSFWAD